MEILMDNFSVLDVFQVGTAKSLNRQRMKQFTIFLWRHLLGSVSRRIDIFFNLLSLIAEALNVANLLIGPEEPSY